MPVYYRTNEQRVKSETTASEGLRGVLFSLLVCGTSGDSDCLRFAKSSRRLCRQAAGETNGEGEVDPEKVRYVDASLDFLLLSPRLFDLDVALLVMNIPAVLITVETQGTDGILQQTVVSRARGERSCLPVCPLNFLRIW